MELAESAEFDPGEGSLAGRKRKRDRGRRKLLVGEKVEVRLSDEGLKGSWHRAEVVKCGQSVRWVRYEEILAADNVTKLVEPISVTGGADGLTNKPHKRYRGWIRPITHAHIGDGLQIAYGMCVDCLIDDAWWEGVIFDKEEGSSQRMVFFPDQGDRHMIDVSQMRWTCEWDEISGDWQCRGAWTLLALLGKLEEKGPFPISIREIWYDISCMDAYQENIGEWVFGSWLMWHRLVRVALREALSVSMGQEEIVNFTSCTEKKDRDALFGSLEARCIGSSSGTVSGTQLAPENSSVTLSKKKQPTFLKSKLHMKFWKRRSKHSKKVNRGDCLETPTRTSDDLMGCSNNIMELKKEISDWVTECRSNGKYARGSNIFRKKSRRYLVSAGWKIEKLNCGVEKYVSPNGDGYMTMIAALEACNKPGAFAEPTTPNLRISSVIGNDQSDVHDRRTRSMTRTRHSNLRDNRENQDDKLTVVSEELAQVGQWEPMVIEAEYCPETAVAYAQYLKNGKSKLKENEGSMVFKFESANLRKHLVALGWRILWRDGKLFNKQPTQPFLLSKTRYLYISPDGKKYTSLQKVFSYLISIKKHLLTNNTSCKEHLVPQNCPEALLAYINCVESKNNKLATISRDELSVYRVKALKHLLFMGWSFYYVNKGTYKERRYSSPSKKSFCSLLKACKALLDVPIQNFRNDGGSITNKLVTVKQLGHPHIQHIPKFRNKIQTSAQVNAMQEHKQLSHVGLEMGITFHGRRRKRAKKINNGMDDNLTTPVSFEASHDTSHKTLSKLGLCLKKAKKRKVGRALDKDIFDPCSDASAPRLNKQGRVTTTSPGRHVPRTVLSWLIENGIISPRQKVKYLRKRDGQVLMEGRITHGGIKCKCCKNVLTLSNFESHAGSSYHRPAANIFLQDGRSLLDCQRQLLESKNPKMFCHKRIKRDYSVYPSDAICSICQEGGTLLLCDYCPSSFHIKCVGLEDIPEGKWFCPSCKCSICGLSEFNTDCEKFTLETKLFCDQCECEYHVGCIQDDKLSSLKCCPEGYWFCSTTCSEIFRHLRKLVGKPIPIASGDYSWTILRAKTENDLDSGAFDKEAMTEEHSKLHVALDVLHECFLKIIECRTKTDLVADLLYNKESELNRLNFWGFYAMLLEKGDEVVSVATFRVYGDKVAEMPLVGTRVKYRRKGMCRLLVNELEKLLNSLGVKRFVLPAVPELLETWTKSFGFTVMTEDEKFLLLRHTFLNFQRTKMCHKLLLPTVKAADQSGNAEQVEKFNMASIEPIRNNSSKVSELVPPILMPCAVATSSGILHSNDFNAGLEASFDASLPISRCLDNMDLMQVDKLHLEKVSNDQTSMNIAPVHFNYDGNFTGSGTTILTMRSAREVSSEMGGGVYESHVGKEFLMKSSSNTFRYIYKRRLLAN